VKLLLIGGPKFLGRAVADAALERGHELTFFNRGRTNPDLYPESERLVGDRDGHLHALAGRTWDSVIDTSGYVPHVVRSSAEALAGSGLYCFVSSISVYAGFDEPVELCEREATGTFNATHPGVTWTELLEACRAVTGCDARITFVSDEFLLENEVGEWMELPLWLAGPANAYADRVGVARALEAGLGFRPLEDTVRTTLEQARVTDTVGLTPKRETALLEKWRER
jgi:hypothetical protein